MSDNSIFTIEVQARKVARPEADQGSRLIINDENEASGSGSCSHGQLIEEKNKLRVVIHGKTTTSRSLQERLNSLKLESEKQIKSRIQKVPFLLRENKNFEKYYEPRVVAIGPIHHRNTKFEYTETIKRRLAGQFIDENLIDAENLYNNIMLDLENLKNCYVEDVIEGYCNDELAWMFLVDGCALLHFIYCVVLDDNAAAAASPTNQGKLQELQIKKDQVAFAQQDMFLFENQLPYQLLELIMRLIVDTAQKDAIEKSIKEFIHNNMMTTAQPPEKLSQRKELCHLLDLLREQLLVCKPTKPKPPTLQTPHSFRNVKELIASGIRLKPTGKSCLDIFFDNCCFIMGTLRLPSLVVDDSTAPKILNLIAYEMCPDFMNDFDVTSYICFLDSLIDHPEDVEELRKAKILTNMLGSDKEVAKLFNKIGTDLVPNPDLYANVKDDIEKHYKNKCISWTAQAYHNYFSSPWTFLAFVGALLALFLSAVQTYFTIPWKKS